MKEWLVFLTEQTIVAIDFAALVLVIFSSVEALVAGVRTMLSPAS